MRGENVVSGQRAGGIHNEERERKRDFIEEEKQNSVSAATATAKRSYMSPHSQTPID